jgi:hypothetical protein
MKLKGTLFSASALLVLACMPLRAQRITGICEANSYNCTTLTDNTYVSIYGTNLPTGSNARVYIEYPLYYNGYDTYAYGYLMPSFTSSTQTNFYLNEAAPGPPLIVYPIYNTNWTFAVCYLNGSCTQPWEIEVVY